MPLSIPEHHRLSFISQYRHTFSLTRGRCESVLYKISMHAQEAHDGARPPANRERGTAGGTKAIAEG